jgi:hypothetical protein
VDVYDAAFVGWVALQVPVDHAGDEFIPSLRRHALGVREPGGAEPPLESGAIGVGNVLVD